jgi:hypothetical protein
VAAKCTTWQRIGSTDILLLLVSIEFCCTTVDSGNWTVGNSFCLEIDIYIYIYIYIYILYVYKVMTETTIFLKQRLPKMAVVLTRFCSILWFESSF